MAPFEVRGFNFCESLMRASEPQIRRFIRKMKDLRMNTLVAYYDYGWKRYSKIILEESREANLDITLAVYGPRTFYQYVEYKPQWFAKGPDGKPYTNELLCETKTCGSCKEAINAFGYGAKEWLKTLPQQIKRVMLRPGDGVHSCICDNCVKLSHPDRWQPFLNEFSRAIADVRPDLSWEAEIYVRRFRMPTDTCAFDSMERIMYDTFGRQSRVPIGVRKLQPFDEEKLHCISEKDEGCMTPNVYHAERISEWTSSFPGKVYIHENLMGQALLGINQHNTGALLKDLKFYHECGVQGVCYEAYGPGFEHFEEQIKVLAEALSNPASIIEYKPTPLEVELGSGRWDKMRWFCWNESFPFEKYFTDPVVIKHIRNYARFLPNPNLSNLRQLVEHALEHADRFDSIFVGFHGCDWAKAHHRIDFSEVSEETSDMLSYRKLWDFMETLPNNIDPIFAVKSLIVDAIKRGKDR